LLVAGAAIDSAPTLHARPGGADLVGVGVPPSGITVVVAEPESGTECAEGDEGEIWVAGAGVAQGYLGDPDRSREVFGARLADGRDGFLRTGDLGVWHDGELFVTGRSKDLLIVDGKNHYPQDIEQTVESAHREVRAGCVAAFAIDDPDTAQERAVIAAEVKSDDPARLAEIEDAIRAAVSAEHAVTLAAVVLLRPRTIPKTSSGKIQRQACRVGYLEGSLAVVEPAVPVANPVETPAPVSVRSW
ncbi:hypothetical protein ACW9HQ_41995, partial [Nocardia gipuzkoensis]